MADAALGPEMTLDISQFARLEVDGYDTNFGTIAVGGAFAQVSMDSVGFGQLNQLGTVTVGTATSLGFGPNTQLNNAGSIELAGGSANTYGKISGSGTIELATPNSLMDAQAGDGNGWKPNLQRGLQRVQHIGQ